MIVSRHLSKRFSPLDGKASTDVIREDLGMCLTREVALVLTPGRSHNSPNIK
jgi:hypothetical protein